MGKVVAIIPARSGSKGIVGKNLFPFCGKPLLSWSIRQALLSKGIDSVWVTSDGKEILDIAREYGANPIQRPPEISGDFASSESSWIHALEEIEKHGINVDWVVGMQATSPIREPYDIEQALGKIRKNDLDSLLSVVEVEDFFMWRLDQTGQAHSVNYDFRKRKPRQNIEKRYLENGSFYIFRPRILRETNNRLGGKIGVWVMQRHKMFQIDNPEDLQLCEKIMRGFRLDRI